jgi:MFS family permease
MSTAPATTRPGLGSFWHDLPREGRFLLSVVVFEFIGTGLVLPFHVVYLNEVRGFPLSDVGLLLGVPALVGLLAVGPGGSAIDRIGARVIQMGTLSLLVCAQLVLAVAATPAVAAFGLVLNGLGFGVSWPAYQSLVASVIPSAIRMRYFGVNFTLLNLGIGIGGIVGGYLVDVDRLWTFQAVYVADAVSYVPGLLVLLWPLRHVAGRPEAHHEEAMTGYLDVLRRPVVPTLALISFVSSFVGYSQLNTGLPAYARALGRVSTQGLGLAFAANTLVIVVLQLLVLQRIEGRRRTRVIAMLGVAWAVAWALLGTSALVPGTVAATALVAACASVFALGETLLQPTVPVIVNDLAPDHLRGRYNAVSSGSFQLAAVLAPPVAGWLIGHGLGSAYITALVAGSLLLGALAILRLEPQLPDHVNGLPAKRLS